MVQGVKPATSDADQQRHGDPRENDHNPCGDYTRSKHLWKIWTEYWEKQRRHEQADRPDGEPCQQGHLPARRHWTMRIAKPRFETIQLPVGGLALHHWFNAFKPPPVNRARIKGVSFGGAGEAAQNSI